MLGAVLGAVVAGGLSVAPTWTAVATLRQTAEAAVLKDRPGATVKADIDGSTHLPECGRRVQATVRGTGTTPEVVLVCGGPRPWTFYVPVEVTDRRQVVVLTQPVLPGEAITAAMVQAQPRDAAGLSGGYFTDDAAVVGQVAAHAMGAGAVLEHDDVHAAPVIHRGQVVTLEYQSNTLQVQAPGLALDDAASGQTLKVENDGSHRIVSGVAAPDGVVVVGPPSQPEISD